MSGLCNVSGPMVRQNALLFYKELYTGEGCVEMDIPWQLCRTIGPLLSQRFTVTHPPIQNLNIRNKNPLALKQLIHRI